MNKELIDRVIQVRKNANLNQSKFAEKLNLTRSIISLNECGKRNYSKRTLLDICNTFNVNMEWLLNGTGEIYSANSNALMTMLAKEYNLDDLDIKIITQYLKLSPIERQVFKDYIKKLEVN